MTAATPSGVLIRDVRTADAAAIAAIYTPIVRDTAISFEIEPPDAAEFERRIATITQRHPWLVAEDAAPGAATGRVLGYAYASTFRARPAYDRSCESTVYVDGAHHRRGLGRLLMMALLDRLRADGFHRVIAGVTLPNDASVRLHESLGYRPVGVFDEVGFKFGRRHAVGFWDRAVAGDASQTPAIPPLDHAG